MNRRKIMFVMCALLCIIILAISVVVHMKIKNKKCVSDGNECFVSNNSLEVNVISNNEESNKEQVVDNETMVKIKDYIPDIVVDLKYATTENFTGVVIYEDNEAYLRYGTVKKLINAQNLLKEKGYKIVIWDAYRPVEAQYKLWDVCPNPAYVSNPNNGYSKHSRGNTVDISIVELDGSAVELPSGFDDFSKKADRDYSDVSKEAKNNSQMLEGVMKECGFNGYKAEWWHYSDTENYDVF